MTSSRSDGLIARAAGLLLAGGRSSRFGSEKAVASFRSATMMDTVAECFAGLPRFAVSARPGSAAEARARASSIEVLYDAPEATPGPLAGVSAGLAWARLGGFAFLATAPCDAPLLPRNLFAELLRRIGDAPAAYAVTRDGEHPLCAVWRVDLDASLRQALADGAHPAVRALHVDHGARAVHFEHPHAFANANSPDALAALERFT